MDDRRRGGFVHCFVHGAIGPAGQGARLNLVDVAGHQLDVCVLKRLAALVAHGDPAHHVEKIGLAFRVVGDHQVVVGLPAHAAGDVGDFGVELAGIVGLEKPAEGWFEDGIARQRGEQRLARQAEAQHAVHFDDGLSVRGLLIVLRVVGAGDITAAHHLAFDDLVRLHQELDGLAFIERKQQLLRDGIIAVILFQDLQCTSGRIAQDHGIRLQVRRNAGILGAIHARTEVKWHIFPRHKEILVVDGERGLVVGVGSLFLSHGRAAQQDHDQHQLLHSGFSRFAVDGKEEAFRSCPENAGFGETCREFLTTEDKGDTEVIAGNHTGA